MRPFLLGRPLLHFSQVAMNLPELYRQTADVIRKSRALVITAGAGMGVDSGLPDFRGEHGFWNAYPMYERLGISFAGAANPAHFDRDPAFGWGFYGHRTNLYRETTPHAGFAILLDWRKRFGLDCFVVTSNVDGQFQKAGFAEENVLEVHGSIHWLQCTKPCSGAIWENNETIPVEFTTMRARHIPSCIHCGAPARPNILMFGDWSWLSDRTDRQEQSFDDFITGALGDCFARTISSKAPRVPELVSRTTTTIEWSGPPTSFQFVIWPK